MSMTVSRDGASLGNVKMSTMSFAQEGLWLLDQLEPGSAINAMTATVEVGGALLPDVLETSLNLLVERHEILRTSVGMHEGHLVQVIAPHLHIPLRVTDLRARAAQAAQQAQAQAQRLATEQAQAPFVLDQGPLLRCTLVHLSGEQSLLLLHLHRIVSDDWSVGLLVRELACLYDACAAGGPSPLPPLPWQYADFATWQREWLQGEAAAAELAYWRQRLAGSPAALDLPTDHPRPAVASVCGATAHVALPGTLTQALGELSRQHAVQLDMILTAAWLSVLARYSSQQDLLVGTISPARRHAHAQALIGPCENTLVLRTDLSDSSDQLSFLDLVQRVREGMQAAQTHGDLPLEPLLKALAPTRSWSQQPLFSVLLRLPAPRPAMPAGWKLAGLQVHRPGAEVDLRLDLQQSPHESPHGWLARFVYRPELFEEASIARMAGHWQTLLEGIVTEPGRPLARLPLLTAGERHQLLVEWTGTRREYPRAQGVQRLFEAQVQRSPRALAAVCEGEQVSYQELNRQANLLAHHLRAQGVGPESLVALLAERGIPFLVAILAIFKAGGAYVPLDPHHPPARLCRVLERSGCALVLTTAACDAALEHALEDLPREARPRCIVLEDVSQASDRDEENPPPASTPENLAYVMYTSGSTGQPKGAMVEGRGMLNHLYAKIEALDLTAADTLAQTASQCFDISVWQFLAALLVGGRVQIYPDAVAHDAALLLQHVERDRVSILETVPSLLRAMLTAGRPQGSEHAPLSALRWLIPTGEALPVDLCRHWLQRYPHVPLLNAYGPTECSDDVTHYVIAQPPAEGTRSIPIGTAIPNMRLYVLDRHLEPLPIGVSGELYVGGIGVGRGYLGEEQRTAQAFVPDPFVPKGDGRLYKTGDLARYLPDGNLEFLGRVDYQVKVRGYRIELGEIEAVLSQHPAVREAVVVAREAAAGEQLLVAYVVLHQELSATVEQLKSQLKQQVPVYMVPAAFVLLDRLPLTANGKLDRTALPAPEPGRGGRGETAESYVAPVLPLQRQLVQIWEEVLGVRPIGIRDDFFELGGDSLSAVRLFERMERVSGKRLALATLFGGATIEQVASVLGEETQAQTRAPLVVVQAGGSRRPFFYLHGEFRGGALYSRELARHVGPEQPFYLLEPYRFDGLAVPPALQEMAAAHLETLRSVQPEGPYLLGGYCNGGLVAYEMARQLHAQGQAVDLLLLIDPDAPARHRLVRRAINSIGRLLLIDQKQQFEWFLCLQHMYRYLRFSHYRQSKNSELLGTLKQGASGRKPGNGSPAPLHLRRKALVPNVEALRQDYLNLYDWPASDYAPGLYAGKITFFWTSEEPWRSIGWQKVVKAKEKEVEIQMLPGNHITSRTDHLPVLAECLRTCLRKAQEL